VPKTFLWLLSALFGLAPSIANICEGALPTAPFKLGVWPAHPSEGGPMIVGLALRNAEEASQIDEPFDLYVVANRQADRAWTFLTPEGAWSATPAAYQQRITRQNFTPFIIRFDSVAPFGWYRIAVRFVRTSEFPSRKHYVFQPLLTWVRVQPPWGSASNAVMILGPLGILTAAAWVLVMFFPRPRRLPKH